MTQEEKDAALVQAASALVRAADATDDARLVELSEKAVQLVVDSGGIRQLLIGFAQCQAALAEQPKPDQLRRQMADDQRAALQGALKQKQETQATLNRQMADMLPTLMRTLAEQTHDRNTGDGAAAVDASPDSSHANPDSPGSTTR